MKWARKFIGVPDVALGRSMAGADCWGLAMLVYRDCLDIQLPDPVNEYGDDRDHAEIALIADREKASARWVQTTSPQEFDLCLFSIGRHDSHVGIYLGPGIMLHTVKGDCAKIAQFDMPPWRDRLVGFYRWAG